MKKKTKKIIKALETRIIQVENISKIATDFLNDMYEAQTKWFISKGNGEIFDEFIKSIKLGIQN